MAAFSLEHWSFHSFYRGPSVSALSVAAVCAAASVREMQLVAAIKVETCSTSGNTGQPMAYRGIFQQWNTNSVNYNTWHHRVDCIMLINCNFHPFTTQPCGSASHHQISTECSHGLETFGHPLHLALWSDRPNHFQRWSGMHIKSKCKCKCVFSPHAM